MSVDGILAILFVAFLFFVAALLTWGLHPPGPPRDRLDTRPGIDRDRPEDPALETRRLKEQINAEHERNFGRCPFCGRGDHR
jgi:hypothetical protein